MEPRCKNCKYLIKVGDSSYKCLIYEYDVNPELICSNCKRSCICHQLVDRLKEIDWDYKKGSE